MSEIEILNYDTSRLDGLTGHVADFGGHREPAQASRLQRYVPASPAVNMASADLGAVEYNIAMPVPATAHVETRGTHVDRGWEFVLKTGVLAVVLGILTAAVTVICWQAPITGGFTLLAFWLVFAGVWLIAYLDSSQKTPEGIAHMQAATQCGVVRDVMDARLEDYRERSALERQLFAKYHNLEVNRD